jgi:integrase
MTNEIVKRGRGRPIGTTKGELVLALSDEELERFLRETRKDRTARLQFSLIVFLGLRVSELTELKVSDVNLNSALAVVRVQGKKGGYKKSYDLPPSLSKQLRQYVRTLPNGSLWLFPGRTPEDHTARITLQFHFNRLRDKAGLDKKFSIHSLRHTCAMMKVKQGDSPVMIQNWLRQKSLDSTMKYFRLGANSEYNSKVSGREDALYR